MAQLKYNTPTSFLVDQTTGEHFPLDSEMLIGSKSGFKGEGLSAQHCLIRSNGYQFFIIDLKSQAGTLVNGEAVPSDEWTPLHHGQQITVGSLNIIFSDTMYAFSSDSIVISDSARLKAVKASDAAPIKNPVPAVHLAMHFFDGFFYMFAAYFSFLTSFNFLAFPASKISLLLTVFLGPKE